MQQQQYMATMCYEHENYINDKQRKEQYKRDMMSLVTQSKISFFKKRKVLKMVRQLCDFQYLLGESEQKKLMLNEEIWSSDCLEYNVNLVYEYIVQNSLESQKVNIHDIINFCRVENDIDIKFIKMNDTLRRSKDKNPIIILVNKMFLQPFVINGNHRIRRAYDSGIDEIEVYILQADNVVHCLISEDYKQAYRLYQKIYKLVGMKLNC